MNKVDKKHWAHGEHVPLCERTNYNMMACAASFGHQKLPPLVVVGVWRNFLFLSFSLSSNLILQLSLNHSTSLVIMHSLNQKSS